MHGRWKGPGCTCYGFPPGSKPNNMVAAMAAQFHELSITSLWFTKYPCSHRIESTLGKNNVHFFFFEFCGLGESCSSPQVEDNPPTETATGTRGNSRKPCRSGKEYQKVLCQIRTQCNQNSVSFIMYSACGMDQALVGTGLHSTNFRSRRGVHLAISKHQAVNYVPCRRRRVCRASGFDGWTCAILSRWCIIPQL